MKHLLFSCHAMPAILLCASLSFFAFGCKKPNNDVVVSTQPDASHIKFKAEALALTELHPFKVMSFNIRGNSTADPQTIQQRIPLIINIISDNTPDIVGFQEYKNSSGDATIMQNIANQMFSLGYARTYAFSYAGGSAPKAIFFKAARFTVQSSDRFNLSVWRSGVWAFLTDQQTSKQYFVVNSHWENASAETRLINAHVVDSLITAKNTAGLPIICFGDFNAQPGTPEINFLKNSHDLVDALGDSDGDDTFHGWDATGNWKLDWMMSNRDMAYLSSQVITTSYSGYWPSDHWPVMATYVPAIFKDAVEDQGGYSTGTSTQYFFADVNGDGKEDKIYWNKGVSSGSPRVFLSNGNGTYASAINHTAGASTLSTTNYHYADVNGDGKADEIVWDRTVNSGHTRVFLATTNGNFSSTAIVNPEGWSQGSATVYNFADVNGDGKADKIYWNATVDGGHTRVYLATTGGSFNGTVISGSTGASTTADTRFYYADVNGDGKYDKILWHPSLNSGKTMVYLSDGDGTFTTSSSFSTDGPSVINETKFYFADINGDGRADKVYWRYNVFQGQVKVYFSKTNNTFDGPVYSLRGTATTAATIFYFTDITGDGKADQVRWNYQQYDGKLRSYAAN